ncbi:hypothetical protein BC941DRAFT_465329 [Chlamydoabsidia padenii]|nr:hypothetical protein BC941DRAFT_465329 [Chlamydoabsidia padenii]
MVASNKKSKAASTTKTANTKNTQPKQESASGKKVSFAQEKRVKTFYKDKALLKRKADEEQEQEKTTEVKKAKKSAIRQVKKPVEEDLPSSDEEEETDVGADLVANDTVLDVLTEEQEEALRKEILGDLADEDEDEDSSEDDDQLDQDDDLIGANASVVSLTKEKKNKKAEETKTPTTTSTPISSTTGWVYVGRIPDAFKESDMRKYFEQFGDIVNLRISRNNRGQSRHYGFIEFLAQDVAEIVAETMHNFLLDGRLLQCKVIPMDQRHPKTFEHLNTYIAPGVHIDRHRHGRNKTEGMDVYLKRAQALIKDENKKRAALKKLDIDYDFPGYAASQSYWLPKMKAKLDQDQKEQEAREKVKQEQKELRAKAKAERAAFRAAAKEAAKEAAKVVAA